MILIAAALRANLEYLPAKPNPSSGGAQPPSGPDRRDRGPGRHAAGDGTRTHAGTVLDPRALDPQAVERVIAARGLRDLQYYNGETHRAVFALPNYVKALVA